MKNSYELAVISWVVPYTSYTPEIYTLLYSTSLSYLNTTGGQAFGRIFFSTLGESYSIILQGLTANTTYYYTIISSNSYGTTMSTVFSSQTLTNGKKYIHVCHFDSYCFTLHHKSPPLLDCLHGQQTSMRSQITIQCQ